MFLSDEDFERRFGHLFREEKKRLETYVQNPELLLNEVKKNQADMRHAWESTRALPKPKPDEFKFHMTHFRGLLNHPKRLQNWVVSKNEGFSEKRLSMPVRLDIEPISKCNFRCVMCQVSGWENGSRAENLQFEHLKHIVQEQYGLVEVKLQGFGEPLMHKEFIPMIEHLVAQDIWVRTTVNGSLLHIKDYYKKLMDSGVGDVNISFDGATKEVFEGIRRRSDFDVVVENMTKLNEYANSKDLSAVRMWTVLQKSNRHQIFDFVELAKKMQVRRLTFSIGLSDWGQKKWETNNNSLQASLLTDDEVDQLMKINDSGDIEITFWNLQAKYSSQDPQKICNWPFEWGFISSDLRTVPCCMIGNPDVIDLGPSLNFQETWNSPRYQAFRRAHIKGDIPSFCQTCYKE